MPTLIRALLLCFIIPSLAHAGVKAADQTITLRVIDMQEPVTIQAVGCWNGEHVAKIEGIKPEGIELRGFTGALAQDHIRHCLEWVLQSLQPCEEVKP